jgi:hypothetical protein
VHWINTRLIASIEPSLYVSSTELPALDMPGKAQQLWLQERGRMLTMSTLTLLLRWITTHSQGVCFVFFFVNLLASPNFLSLVVPLSILYYAIIENPRATRPYWNLVLRYQQLLICVKFVFQLPKFCITVDATYALQPNAACLTDGVGLAAYSFPYLLGLYKSPFFGYVVGDLLCLIVTVFHRLLLKSHGIWSKLPHELGDPMITTLFDHHVKQHLDQDVPSEFAQALSRLADDHPDDHIDTSPSNPTFQVQSGQHTSEDEDIFEDRKESAPPAGLVALLDCLPAGLRYHVFSILPYPKVDLVKPGRDFYFYIFVCQLLTVFVVLGGYDTIATVTALGSSNALTTSRFSGEMVGWLFFQIILLVVDRILFLNRLLWAKFILHMFTTTLFHILVFFVWPVSSQNPFSSNWVLIVFYLCQMTYCVVSGLQLRFGYKQFDTSHHVLSENVGTCGAFIFRLYNSIPFVYETRILLDWMTITTALDLWETLKLESIFWALYQVKCNLVYMRKRKRGEVLSFWPWKFLNSTLLFLAILLLILGPLWLFSSANPATVSNNVDQISVQVLVHGPSREYPLFATNSLSKNDSAITEAMYQQLLDDRYLSNISPRYTVQHFVVSANADFYWSLTPPRLSELINLTSSATPVTVSLQLTFTRALPADQPSISYQLTSTLAADAQLQLATMLRQQTTASIVLTDLFPAFLRLPATGSVINPNSTAFSGTYALALNVVSNFTSGTGAAWYWGLHQLGDVKTGVDLFISSDPIVPTYLLGNSANYSIFAVYLTVIFTVGQFLRLSSSTDIVGIPSWDMHDVDKLMSLCNGIFIARRTRHYLKEETLYRKLIRVFRSTQDMIELSRRPARVDEQAEEAEAQAVAAIDKQKVD